MNLHTNTECCIIHLLAYMLKCLKCSVFKMCITWNCDIHLNLIEVLHPLLFVSFSVAACLLQIAESSTWVGPYCHYHPTDSLLGQVIYRVAFLGHLSSQVKSSHLYLYSAFNNTDCVKALNSIKLEDRVSVMYNNKIKHSIFS